MGSQGLITWRTMKHKVRFIIFLPSFHLSYGILPPSSVIHSQVWPNFWATNFVYNSHPSIYFFVTSENYLKIFPCWVPPLIHFPSLAALVYA